MSSPQPAQIEGDAILCTDVLTDGLTEIINLNCIPSVQVHDKAVTRLLPAPRAWVGYARLPILHESESPWIELDHHW